MKDNSPSRLLKDICIFFGAVIFLVLGFLALSYFLPKLENRFFSALTFLVYLFLMAKLFNAGIKKLKQKKFSLDEQLLKPYLVKSIWLSLDHSVFDKSIPDKTR